MSETQLVAPGTVDQLSRPGYVGTGWGSADQRMLKPKDVDHGPAPSAVHARTCA